MKQTELLERIKARCIEEGDCWIWQGATSGPQRELPQMTVREDGRKINRSVRRELREDQTGVPVPDDKIVSTTCRTFRCANPDHFVELTISDRNKRCAQDGFYADPVRRAKHQANARERFSHLTLEAVADIRSARTAAEAAERHGITKSNAVKIRAHETWREYSSPFAGLMG